MPDQPTLHAIYGPGYAELVAGDRAVPDPKTPELVVDFLRSQPAGIFLDYGCGDGTLLSAAEAEGWRAIGVEFDAEVVASVAKATGIETRTSNDVGRGLASRADVVHVGDVLEHLTNLRADLQRVLDLIRPGGFLVAQGPLQNGATAFNVVLAITGRLRPNRRIDQPPTHVTQSTRRGQLMLFRRAGLEAVEFEQWETWWPAPNSLRSARSGGLRGAALHAAKRGSMVISGLDPERLGDRYFFVGRKP